jgi:hypothetical protein
VTNLMQPPELDSDARSVIDAARGGHEPNELARARVRRGVELKLAAGVALVVGPATSAFASAAVKVTAAVVAVGAVVTAGAYVIPHYQSKPAPVRAPAARVAPPVAVPVEVVPIEAPAPVAPPRHVAIKHRAPAAPTPVPVENVSSLKEETVLLGTANAAIARGDIKRALSALEDYDRRPGSGLLAEERTVTGILASCAAGKVDTARAEARHFRARWPRSPLGARVDASCAGPSGPSRASP